MTRPVYPPPTYWRDHQPRRGINWWTILGITALGVVLSALVLVIVDLAVQVDELEQRPSIELDEIFDVGPPVTAPPVRA